MKHPTYRSVLVLLVGALLLVSCQQPAASPSAPSGAGSATSAPEATRPPSAPTEAAPSLPAEDEPVAVSDIDSALSALDSYAVTFEMTFEGTDDSGAAQSSSMAWLEEYSKNPPARRISIENFGADTLGAGVIETIEIGGKVYSRFGDICTATDSTGSIEATLTFSPSDIIGDISSAQFVGVETVNGVSARHFIVDLSAALAVGAFTQGSAEAWITDNGIVVRYALEATGSNTFFGGDSQGTVKWEYNVTSINQPVNIVAPEDCGGAPEDIPLMPDAEDVSSFGDLTTYTSPSAMADVVAFYNDQMPANGWTAGEGGLSTETFASLTFTKDGRTATITITPDSSTNGTSVLLQVSE